jgi:glycosyltransferase involved in cell wall biosynthesis
VQDKHLSCSVALCTFNGERFLQAQLESLLNQTRLPDEVVVGDDASTDGSVAALRAFSERAEAAGVTVRLHLSMCNAGFVENFSGTVERASGDVLCFCDQDDVWHPEKLSRLMDLFERNQDLLFACSDGRLVDADGHDLGVGLFEALELTPGEWEALRSGRAFEVLVRRSMATGATAAFSAHLRPMALPVGKGWIHDEWFAVIAAAMGQFAVVEDSLIAYRQHGGNQVGMRKRTMTDKWRDLRAPRRAQFGLEAERMGELERRLMLLGCAEEKIQAVAERRKHFECRESLGHRPPWRRMKVIVREALAGRYRRFGTGARSILRDLLRRD